MSDSKYQEYRILQIIDVKTYEKDNKKTKEILDILDNLEHVNLYTENCLIKYCIETDDVDFLTTLINKYKYYPNVTLEKMNHPLTYICNSKDCNLEIVKILLNNMLNLSEFKDTNISVQPVISAIKFNNLDLLLELLKHKPYINANVFKTCINNHNFHFALILLEYINKIKYFISFNDSNINVLNTIVSYISTFENIYQEDYDLQNIKLSIQFLYELIKIIDQNNLGNINFLNLVLLQFDSSILELVIKIYYDNNIEKLKIINTCSKKMPILHTIIELDSLYKQYQNKINKMYDDNYSDKTIDNIYHQTMIKLTKIDKNIDFMLNIYRNYYNKNLNIIEILMLECHNSIFNKIDIDTCRKYLYSDEELEDIKNLLPMYYYYIDCVTPKDYLTIKNLTKDYVYICKDLLLHILEFNL